MKAFITAYGAALPERVVTNAELAQGLEVTPEWIETNCGIRERRWAGADQAASDLAVLAIKAALAQAEMDAKEIDYLIGGTLSPDFQLPGIAPIIQHKLGCREIPAIDLRVGCVAILYSLQIARGLIAAGSAEQIVCVGAEVQSKGLDISRKSAELSMLFGDGAGALLVGSEPRANNLIDRNQPGYAPALEIVDILIGSDGSCAEDLMVRAPGSANGARWLDPTQLDSGSYQGSMNGRKVIMHAVRKLATAASEIIARNNLTLDQIALVVPHQANLNLLRAVAKQLSLNEDRLIVNLDRFGNTSGASAFFALHQAQTERRLPSGEFILILAFGAGFTWGSALCRVV